MAELSSIGDTVVISVTKDGIKFSTSGDIGSANVTCRQNTSVDKQASTAALLWCLIAFPLTALTLGPEPICTVCFGNIL